MREHYKTILQAIASAIGPAVLIPAPYASKKPLDTGWTTLTLEQTQTPEYMERFSRPCNIGVLLGVPSLNLCTLDVDAPAVTQHPAWKGHPQLSDTQVPEPIYGWFPNSRPVLAKHLKPPPQKQQQRPVSLFKPKEVRPRQ